MAEVRIELFRRPTHTGNWVLIIRKRDDGKVEVMKKNGEWIEENPLQSIEECYIRFGEDRW